MCLHVARKFRREYFLKEPNASLCAFSSELIWECQCLSFSRIVRVRAQAHLCLTNYPQHANQRHTLEWKTLKRHYSMFVTLNRQTNMSSDSFKTILRSYTGFRFKGQQGFYRAKQSWSRCDPASHHHIYLCSRIFCKTLSEVWNPFPGDEFLLPPGPQFSPFFFISS